ncbi:MAG: hypothetical protein AAB605_00585 [Patescibacteria group bacterium]
MSHAFNARLGIGPMSTEAIEATFHYSHFYRKELMLIASKNQIDWGGGYVNNWTTRDYIDFVRAMRAKYPLANVHVCRDHCGPGFNGIHDLKDVYKTIEDDIASGFDLIHIDFCHFLGTKDEQFDESRRAIKHCLMLNPKIRIEVGTDENIGVTYGLPNINELEREIDFFRSVCDPEFYVVQTGSLVLETHQAGSFNTPFVEKMSLLLREKGIKMKEHNADYLTEDDILLRKGLVGAMNIAPQLGVIQTHYILSKCAVYGLDSSEFLNKVYESGKWKKWLKDNTAENKMLCCTIAGHYLFASDEYRRLVDKLERYEDVREAITNELAKLIDHYVAR